MTQLFIHVGPHKKGTTSIQKYFWAYRDTYIGEGLLFPETGIIHTKYGSRHLFLAKSYDEDIWRQLADEIERHKCPKVLLSAERFSAHGHVLVAAKQIITKFDTKFVIFVRDERDLVPSRYLQRMKSSLHKLQKGKPANLESFDVYWKKMERLLSYSTLVNTLGEAFGPERLVFVHYKRIKGYNSIDGICEAIGVPVFEQAGKFRSNPSITPFEAELSLAGERFGPFGALVGLKCARLLETIFKSLARRPIKGYDPDAALQKLRENNRDIAQKYPEFAKVYGRLHD